jgi:acyl-CoA thioesterase-1
MAMTRRRWLAHCSAALALAAAAAAMPAFAAATRTLLVVGDSLSAEYGLVRGTGWVALLEERIAREKIAANVVNASISGDTTAGGLARLPALLREKKPAVVVIELGGNDALRGLPLERRAPTWSR